MTTPLSRPEHWRELAEAFHAFTCGHQASAVLVRVSLNRPTADSARLIGDQVGVLLGRWRDEGNDEQRKTASSWWLDLGSAGAQRALLEAVRERFASGVSA